MGGLPNLDAIVETHVGKGGLVFARKCEAFANDIIDSLGYVLVRAGKSKIINLAKEKDLIATERGGINGMIVFGTLEFDFGRED